MMKSEQEKELKIVIREFGKTIFETSGKPKKCIKELDLFKARKLM